MADFELAEFEPAVDETLGFEGGFVHNEVTGEVANFGITVWFLRAIGRLHGSGFPSADEISYVQNLTREEAIALYRQYFWEPHRFALVMHPQGTVNKLFDLTVNMGPGAPHVIGALTLAQETVNELNPGVTPLLLDGVFGSITLTALNNTDSTLFLPRYKVLVAERYTHIAAANKNLRGDLPGWLERLAS